VGWDTTERTAYMARLPIIEGGGTHAREEIRVHAQRVALALRAG
jgi:hypothetical protein